MAVSAEFCGLSSCGMFLGNGGLNKNGQGKYEDAPPGVGRLPTYAVVYFEFHTVGRLL
jgi:hypothetical protein